MSRLRASRSGVVEERGTKSSTDAAQGRRKESPGKGYQGGTVVAGVGCRSLAP